MKRKFTIWHFAIIVILLFCLLWFASFIQDAILQNENL